MSESAGDVLPDQDDPGVHGVWKVTDRNDKVFEFEADFLGFGSSFKPFHNHVHPPAAPKGTHCSTCRWSETWIFQEGRNDPEGTFIVISFGRSDVPGEITFITFGRADGVPDLIKALTLQPNGKFAVTPSVSYALKTAAEYSEEIDAAYSGLVK